MPCGPKPLKRPSGARCAPAPAAIMFLLVSFALGAIGVQSSLAAPNTFSATGSLINGRYNHTATLLPNGKVLVAGGRAASGYLVTAELYDPATGSWSATGSLATARERHTATLLPNGTVLVTGGGNYQAPSGSSVATASAELYDPATGRWSTTRSLTAARVMHTATLLPNGKVLVAGGYSAELYDPATGSWSATGSLTTGRSGHTATLLSNGKVLVAGGYPESPDPKSAELYDPATGTWRATGSLTAEYYFGHTATLLPDGKVLVAGGADRSAYASVTNADLYNPATANWAATAPLAIERSFHAATLLPDGKVLMTGGYSYAASTRVSEMYDPATARWSATGSLSTHRENHTATLLANGNVLVAGGYGPDFASAELYDTATPPDRLQNISTRTSVKTGEQVTNGGFIVSGNDPKPVLIRALGPTLANSNVSGSLQDPTLDLHNSTSSIATNDDWQQAANASEIPVGLRPSDPRESAILVTLPPGNYTAIMAGKNGTVGMGLVEVYDMNTGTVSQLSDVSTRGFVGTGDSVMIGGFITSSGTASARVVVRALGPTLSASPYNLPGVLANPMLTLKDANGVTIAANDNWRDNSQSAAEVSDRGFAPPSDLESAIVTIVSPGNYTAVVSGSDGGTGIALVEVYNVP